MKLLRLIVIIWLLLHPEKIGEFLGRVAWGLQSTIEQLEKLNK